MDKEEAEILKKIAGSLESIDKKMNTLEQIRLRLLEVEAAINCINL